MEEWMEIIIRYYKGSREKPVTIIFRKEDVLTIVKAYSHARGKYETIVWFKVQKTIDNMMKNYFTIPADCMDKLKEKLDADCDLLEIDEE